MQQRRRVLVSPAKSAQIKVVSDILSSHGNCYAAGTVCCDHDAVQCGIGQLCNACGSGQTCTSGASTCAGSGGSVPTTKPSTSPTTITIPISQTTKTTAPTTVNPTTTNPTTTTIDPTTGGGSSTPSVVSKVGNFVSQGCYQDTTSARILVAGSSQDQSSSGMTVEKCIALARADAWQYAGVEFGGCVKLH